MYPLKKLIFHLRFIEEGKKGTERLSNLSKIAQLVRGQVGLGIQTVLHQTAYNCRNTHLIACSLKALVSDSTWLACQRSPSLPNVTVGVCGLICLPAIFVSHQEMPGDRVVNPGVALETGELLRERFVALGTPVAPQVTVTQPASFPAERTSGIGTVTGF